MRAWLDEYGRLRLGWRIALAIIICFAANVIALLAAEFLAGRSPRLLEAIYRPVLAVLLLIAFSVLLIVADRVKHNPVAAMGLGLHPGWLREAGMGVALGTAMVSAAVVYIAIWGSLSLSLRFNSHVAALIALELFILITGALAEELMFRGYPFQRVVDALGAVGAIVIFSIQFGLVHLGNPHISFWAVSNTIAVGVLLSVAYLRTRALWLPWGIHFGWNTALGLGFGLPVSGLTDFGVVVHGRAQGPVWLTGGAYGIEGSAVGTVVILLGFLPLMFFTGARHGDTAEGAACVESAGEPESPAQAGRIQL